MSATANDTKQLSPELQAELEELRAIKASAIESGSHVERPDYKVKKGDENSCHLYVERVSMVGNKKVSKPHVVKIGSGMYEQWMRDRKLLGLTIHYVLHWPTRKDWKGKKRPEKMMEEQDKKPE